ncbi:sigma-70 family RNA polymerase sigma factor [Shewanella glacialipiscicola]|uniref:sigma-70 family RNA polymerase sigma factor n=1 Tax=Shewanella glacialipiscicola TaxID=614069 RepID=UPI003D7A5DCB
MENIQSQSRQNRYHGPITSLTNAAMDNDTPAHTNLESQVDALVMLILQVADNRDKAAFGQLFQYFMPKIRAFGLQRLNQQGLAMDLVQETMTSVWTKAHLYNAEKGAVTTWVFTIMRNQCFDMLRRVQHNREDTFGDDIWPLCDATSEYDIQPDHKLTAQLLKHLDALPLAQKQVVQGIYMQELTQQELADALKVPIGTIKSRLRLGLEKLKSFLEIHND